MSEPPEPLPQAEVSLCLLWQWSGRTAWLWDAELWRVDVGLSQNGDIHGYSIYDTHSIMATSIVNRENAGRLSHLFDLGVLSFKTHLPLLWSGDFAQSVRSTLIPVPLRFIQPQFQGSSRRTMPSCWKSAPSWSAESGPMDHQNFRFVGLWWTMIDQDESQSCTCSNRLGHSFTTDALGNRRLPNSERQKSLWQDGYGCSVLDSRGRWVELFGVPNSLKNKLWFSGPVLYCVLEGSISFSSFVVAILVVSETLMHADMLMSEYLE